MVWPSDVDGGSGKREKFSGGPVYTGSESFKRSILAIDLSVLASDGRDGKEACAAVVAADTSKRFRSSGTAMVSVRSCAADAEGLNLLDVIPPFRSAVISSPLADGPAETNWAPFCDLLSVDVVPWLPLLSRFRYFSIASAPLSSIRFATGERADDKLDGGPNMDPFVIPAGNVVVLEALRK